MAISRILIQGATILTLDPRIGDLRGDILIDGSRIVAVSPSIPAEGARACGLEAKTGSLTPGKEADIVLIDTDSLNLIPMNNPKGVVVECAHVGNIDTVIVGGRIVKRDKSLLGVDLRQVRARVDASRDALFRRANVSSDGSWLPRPFSDGVDIAG